MMKIRNRKLGAFSIRFDAMVREFELVKKIYSVFVPIKVDYNVVNDSFDCCGISEYFDDCVEGEMIPYYNLIFTTKHEKSEFDDIVGRIITDFKFERRI